MDLQKIANTLIRGNAAAAEQRLFVKQLQDTVWVGQGSVFTSPALEGRIRGGEPATRKAQLGIPRFDLGDLVQAQQLVSLIVNNRELHPDSFSHGVSQEKYVQTLHDLAYELYCGTMNSWTGKYKAISEFEGSISDFFERYRQDIVDSYAGESLDEDVKFLGLASQALDLIPGEMVSKIKSWETKDPGLEKLFVRRQLTGEEKTAKAIPTAEHWRSVLRGMKDYFSELHQLLSGSKD